MRGSPRTRTTRGLRFAGTAMTFGGLVMTLFLVLAQVGIVAAGADDRDRDGAFGSDTTVVADDSGGGGGGTNAPQVTTADPTSDQSTAPAVPTRQVRPQRAANPPKNEIQICHGTSSVMNPYNALSPDVNSSGGQQQVFGPNGHAGHAGTPPGTLYTPGVSQNGDDWGDIIPPFDYIDQNGNTQHYAGLNWTAQGQAIWNNNCTAPAAPPALSTPTKGGPVSVAVGATNQAYTVSVTNNGGSAATNVTITDAVPGGLTVTSVTWAKTNPAANGSCSAAQSVSCNVGSLAAGQSVTVTITFSVTAGACPGPLANTASVTAHGIARAGSNTVNTNVTNCPAGAAPDIAVDKSGPATATEGTPFSYTITVSNLGNAPALAPNTMSDTLPAGVVFTSLAAPVGWTCTTPAPGAGGTISCSTASDLAAGASATFTLTVEPTGTVCANITNTATVSTASPNDQSAANDTDSVVTAITCTPSVTLSKTGGPTGNVNQTPLGTTLSYTVTATNTGNGAAPKVQIVDDLNDQLTNVTVQIVGNPPGNPSCSVGAGNVITCGLFTLASTASPNDSATITISATVPGGICPTVNNTATGSMHTGDPNQASIGPSNTLTTTFQGCGGVGPVGPPALTIAKSATPPLVQVGGAVSFTITVTSVGSVPATNVVLSDTLPSVPGTTWSITGGTAPAGACTIVGNSLSCSFGTMNSPPPTAYTVVVSTSATSTDSCGTYRNTASVSGTGIGTVSSSATATVECASGIDIAKSGPATAKVGDTVTYTFTVTLAPGSPPLGNVTVTDPRCDFGTLVGPNGDGGQAGVLETGETWTYSCTHVVTAGDPDPLPNTATVCADATVCDSDNHEVDVIHPRIVLGKTADPTSGSAGDRITYTYDVTNTGDVDLFDITVDDDVLGHICDIAGLAPDASTQCVGSYTIPRNAPASITNTAVAEGLYTPPSSPLRGSSSAVPLPAPRANSVRDLDTATITVVAGVVVEPPATPGGLAFTGAAAAVPLASVALLLLSVGAGLLLLGRRRGRHVTGPDA